jgi:transcriptional regulator with XRE-family HTH domain
MISAAQCRMARAALQLGVRDLAERARVSASTITRLESGEPLRERTVEAVQKALEAAGMEFSVGAGIGDADVGVRLRGSVWPHPQTGRRTVTLAGSTIDLRCHVAAFYASEEEEERVMMPFLREGQEAGDCAVLVLDAAKRGQRVRRLTGAGIAIAGDQTPGRVTVRNWEEAHLRGGRFDQMRTIEAIGEAAANSQLQGARMTRIWSNQEWALLDVPGVQDIAEYESRINDVLPDYDMAVVCSYDLRRFPAGAVFDILRVHPYAIIAGTLRRNPFYVPSDRFMAELHGRRHAHSHGAE